MTFPPLVMSLRISRGGKRWGIRLWLPLFLGWLLLPVVAVVAAPVALAVGFVFWPARRVRRAARQTVAAVCLVWLGRGLEVDLKASGGKRVYVSLR